MLEARRSTIKRNTESPPKKAKQVAAKYHWVKWYNKCFCRLTLRSLRMRILKRDYHLEWDEASLLTHHHSSIPLEIYGFTREECFKKSAQKFLVTFSTSKKTLLLLWLYTGRHKWPWSKWGSAVEGRVQTVVLCQSSTFKFKSTDKENYNNRRWLARGKTRRKERPLK